MKKDLYNFFSLYTKRTLIIGHRGCPKLAPENTMASFDVCIEKNIPAIELDVHICESGELVVTHDFNLKRVTGYDGLVAETPYKKILELDAGSFFNPEFSAERIPKLNEIFEKYGNSLHYDIELKSRSMKDKQLCEKVWGMIQKFSLEDVCMISSFNPFQVRTFRKITEDTIPTAVIYSDTPEIPRLLRHGAGRYIASCSVLKPNRQLLSESVFNKDSLRKGYPIITWTVDDIKEAKRFIDLGVCGIISNNPEDLLEID
jgi:glycerophosphoryl diester phosphodiesterase